MNKKGLLIVFSGPSGAGKGSVLNELEKISDNIKISISATTRSPRPGEVDGKDYFFINKRDFMRLVTDNQMLEYAEYCGNYYGTPKQTINKWLNNGFDVILEIEVKGGKQIRQICKDSIGIFVVPPSIEELSNRLANRNTNSRDDIKKRLDTAIEEMKCINDYEYTVVNDKISECAKSICSIISAEKLKTKRNLKIQEEVFKNA